MLLRELSGLADAVPSTVVVDRTPPFFRCRLSGQHTTAACIEWRCLRMDEMIINCFIAKSSVLTREWAVDGRTDLWVGAPGGTRNQ